MMNSEVWQTSTWVLATLTWCRCQISCCVNPASVWVSVSSYCMVPYGIVRYCKGEDVPYTFSQKNHKPLPSLLNYFGKYPFESKLDLCLLACPWLPWMNRCCRTCGSCIFLARSLPGLLLCPGAEPQMFLSL